MARTRAVLFILSAALFVNESSAQGKRGLTYSNTTWANYFDGNAQVTWGYNWGMEANGLSSSFEYVPMLWGAPSAPDPKWTDAASMAQNVLGYNEPDLNGQANVIPSIAASAWQSYVQPLYGKVKIGAPAVTNAGNGVLNYMGLGWLDAFFGVCTGCEFDFIPIHWYANDTAANFEAYITFVHDKYQKPVWVTEFMLQDSEVNQIAFLEEVMPWMDSQSWVERYSYFGVFETFLLNGAGTGLSDLGETYATYIG